MDRIQVAMGILERRLTKVCVLCVFLKCLIDYVGELKTKRGGEEDYLLRCS